MSHKACSILVPQPDTKPSPPALEASNANHRPAGESRRITLTRVQGVHWVSLDMVHSVGFAKCVTPRFHNYHLTQSHFTAIKTFCVLSPYPSLAPTPCHHRTSWSPEFCLFQDTWNHTVCGLFRLASSIQQLIFTFPPQFFMA